MKLVVCWDETWAVCYLRLVLDPRRHVTHCEPCTCWSVTWHCTEIENHLRCVSPSDSLWDRCLLIAKFRSDTALKQRTICAMWPSDSLWDRCLLISKFRSAFCSCFAATFYDRRRLATDHQSAARWLHSPHVFDTVSVRTILLLL